MSLKTCFGKFLLRYEVPSLLSDPNLISFMGNVLSQLRGEVVGLTLDFEQWVLRPLGTFGGMAGAPGGSCKDLENGGEEEAADVQAAVPKGVEDPATLEDVQYELHSSVELWDVLPLSFREAFGAEDTSLPSFDLLANLWTSEGDLEQLVDRHAAAKGLLSI